MGIFDQAFPHGLLGLRGAKQDRQQTDDLVAQVAADPELSGPMAPLVQLSQKKMTFDQHAQFRANLVQQASALKTFHEGMADFNQSLDILDSKAVSDDDKVQVGNIRSTAKLAMKFSLSADPKLQEQGQQYLTEAIKQRDAFATTNEAQHIAAQNLKETEGTAGENLRYTRDMDLSKELRTQMNGINDKLTNIDQAQKLLNDPKVGGIGRDLAFVGLLSAIDPGVKRGENGEVRYDGANGLVAQYTDLYNRYVGQPDEEKLKQLNQIANTIRGQVVGVRDKAIASFTKQAKAYGGSPERVLSVVPDYQSPVVETSDEPTPEEPAKPKPSLLEKGAAAGAAAGKMIKDTIVDGIEEHPVASLLGGSTVIEAGKHILKGAPGLALRSTPYTLPVMAAIAVGDATQQQDEANLVQGKDESPAAYQKRIAEYLTKRSGEPIDPGSINTPRPTND